MADEHALAGWIDEAHCRDTVASGWGRVNALPDEWAVLVRGSWKRLPALPAKPEVEALLAELAEVEADYLAGLPEGGWT